ncbi:sulfatase-like hydrolase/transferase [Neorhizobium sp. NCHU2750]|uniref:sulfatase-like hydrolase/transferase n=1 Tax=Neorhizobium sp. NCHU2750 TaxID=1825976 RepID=UPI000E77324F|nr:choline-sulfatase [Neorhizobium sp. NCHU2750]
MNKARNFLVIMSDEHQSRAMGCAGHPFVQTPNLDRLAARGTRFSKAYTPSPICVPARASFATGKYTHQNRMWDNAMPYDGSIPTWGHALQNEGVAVESIGKLHYRSTEDSNGFDAEHIPMMVANGVGMVWALVRDEEHRLTGFKNMLGDYIGPGTSSYTDYDAAISERAVAWLEQQAAAGDDRPWCLYVGLVAPHFPLVTPQEFYDLYPHTALPPTKLNPKDSYVQHPWVKKRTAQFDSEADFQTPDDRLTAMASYYGLCSWLDHNVGKILDTLERTGLIETTTVAYTSDHGENLGARGLWGKSALYEESVSIPMIIAGPGIPAGVCQTPVNLIDLSSTIASYFGGGLEGSPTASLIGLAQSEDDPDRVAFSEFHAAGSVSGAFMIRKGRCKYHHYVGFDPELFDLEDDPEELTDLAGDPAHSGVIHLMQQELAKICDPDATNALAFDDQHRMIERFGGRDAVLKIGVPKPGGSSATPPPKA